MPRVKLTGPKKEEFITAFTPALIRILRETGQPNATEEEVLAGLRDPETTIVFDSPSKAGHSLVACVVTDLHVSRSNILNVVIKKTPR